MCTRWFKVTFWFPSWRSLNLWKGHLTISKRAQRTARYISYSEISEDLRSKQKKHNWTATPGNCEDQVKGLPQSLFVEKYGKFYICIYICMLNLINDQKKLTNPLKCVLAGVWATTVGENPKWSKAPKRVLQGTSMLCVTQHQKLILHVFFIVLPLDHLDPQQFTQKNCSCGSSNEPSSD